MKTAARFDRPSLFRTIAIAIVTVAQLSIAVIAPYAESRSPLSPREHIEESSTGSHQVHDLDACLACTALGVHSTVPLDADLGAPVSGRGELLPSTNDSPAQEALLAALRARAPPPSV